MRIKSSAPCRISLFGGGTDVGEYAEKYGGLCINFAINIRQTVIVGGEQNLLLNDNRDFFKAFTDKKVEHMFNGEIESGLGSSAALAVALTASDPYWNTNFGNYKEMRYWMALNAWDIETIKLKMFGGYQDQFASVYGGLNTFTFTTDKNGVFLAKRSEWDRESGEWLESIILLFSTGIRRKNPKIQEQLKELSAKQIKSLDMIKNTAEVAIDAIKEKNFPALAYLMQTSWQNKLKSNPLMFTKELDYIFQIALKAGAWSGKLLGSGGGGYMIFLAEPDKQKQIIKIMEEIKGVKHIPFKIDYEGVKVEEI